MKEKMLQAAIDYLGRGWSVIPVSRSKKPLIEWKKYQTEKATISDVYDWATKFGDDFNLAVVTGEISGVTILDVEFGGDTNGLITTLMSRSGGGGVHFYYKYKAGIQNKARIRELTDIRGDGGYIILPPSETEKGAYSWLNNEPIVDFPQNILDIISLKETPKLPPVSVFMSSGEIPEYEGSSEGSRNDSTTRYVGKILPLIHPADWETVGWGAIVKANTRNSPPLSERELRIIFDSIKGREKVNPSPRRAYPIVESSPIILDEDEVRLMSEVANLQGDKNRRTFSTGFEPFDKSMRGGFTEGDLVVVTGQTGHGKTSFSQTLTYFLTKNSIGTMFMSYEVLIDAVWSKFQNMGLGNDSVVYSPLKMTSGGLDWVEKKTMEAIEKYGVKCVVIDHLGFLLPNKQKYDVQLNSNYSAFLGGICRDLKMLALKNKLIIILLAHTRKTDRPTINDIRDSSGIAQEADFVFIVERLAVGDDGSGRKKSPYLTGSQEDDTVFSDTTQISLVKNRVTGQTFKKKFVLKDDLFILI